MLRMSRSTLDLRFLSVRREDRDCVSDASEVFMPGLELMFFPWDGVLRFVVTGFVLFIYYEPRAKFFD